MNRIRALLACTLLLVVGVAPARGGEPAQRLLLLADLKSRSTTVDVGLMKPFDVQLVAERDGEKPQISTVVFKLEVPEGLVVVGEELLVESLIALGTPRAGLNLAFHCVDTPQVALFRFRFVASKPLKNASIRLVPDPRTDFRGVVSCKDENYAKWDTPEAVVHVTAH
jgi:hypothetical protein